jgi:hypothetical protein
MLTNLNDAFPTTMFKQNSTLNCSMSRSPLASATKDHEW